MMRRATHSGFKELVMTNHMLIQCYNISIDSEVGFHYAMAIPFTEIYDNSFYDEVLVLHPSKILAVYNTGHKELEAKRKMVQAKPKEAREELFFQVRKGYGELKFLYYLKDELLSTAVYRTPYPVDTTSQTVENCVKTYEDLIHRIKPGGFCLVFNGNRMGLQERVMECPEVYYYTAKYRDKKIRIPLARSMFLGIKEVDQLFISVQESMLPDIYIYAIQLTKRGISETFFGYLLNY